MRCLALPTNAQPWVSLLELLGTSKPAETLPIPKGVKTTVTIHFAFGAKVVPQVGVPFTLGLAGGTGGTI